MPERKQHKGREFRSARLADNSVTLTSNLALDLLCTSIEYTPPDWNQIHQKINDEHFGNINVAQGKLGELHLHQMLQQAGNHANFDINIDPIQDGEKTANFTFEKNHNRNLLAIDITKNHFAEYDSLSIINGLPVVWEVKLVNKKSRGKNKKGDNQKLHVAFKNQRINQIFRPLQEYYSSSQFGYVVVTTQEMLSHDSSAQQEFREKGGLIVPMLASREDFKSRAETIVFESKDNGLQ